MAEMQLSVVKRSQEDIMKCSVCQDVFREPKLLPCIHTFCAKCLKVKTESIVRTATGRQMGACPVCGVSFEIPTGGYDALSKDSYMERFVELTRILKSHSIQTNCGSCSEHRDGERLMSASMFCLDCLMNLCEECCRHHRRSQLTSQHRLISGARDVSSADVSLLRRLTCQKHDGEDIKVYCSQCRTCTCVLCFIEGHEGHSGSPLKTAAEAFKTQILGRVNALAGAVADALDRSQKLQQSRISAEARSEELRREVFSRRDRLRILIGREADGLVVKIDAEQVVRGKAISTEIEGLARRLRILKSYRRYCKSILENGRDEEICGMEGALQTRGTELQRLSCDVTTQCNRTNDDVDCSFRSLKDIPNSSGTNVIVYLQDILDKWEKENPQLAAEQAEQENSNSEIIQGLLEQIASLKNKMEEIESMNSQLKSEIQIKNLALANEVWKTASARQEITKAKGELDEQKKETEKLREKIKKMQKDFDNKETAMKTIVTKLSQDIDKERKNRAEEATKTVKLREEFDRMQEKLKQESESKLKQGKECQFQVKQLEGKLEAKNKSIGEFENKHQEQSKEIRRLKEENSKLEDIVTKIRFEFEMGKITVIESQKRADKLLQELEKERSKNKMQAIENEVHAESLNRQESQWRLLLNSKTSENNGQRELIRDMKQTIERERADGEELRTELNDVKARLSQQISLNEILLKGRNAFRSQLPIVFVLILFVGFFMCCLR